MTKTTDRPIYRIVFIQQEEIQELYAQFISEETLVGFIEADGLLEFGQTQIVSPKEVRRCYIPLHNIIRIDEVVWQAEAEARDNISHLPHSFKKTSDSK